LRIQLRDSAKRSIDSRCRDGELFDGETVKRLGICIALLVAPVAMGSNCSWLTVPPNVTITNTYSVFSTASYSVSNPFSFQCSPNTVATVSLTRGANSSSYNPRAMKIANPPAGYSGSTLTYNLFNTANQIWGDGTGGTVNVVFNPVPTDKIYDQSDGAVISAAAFFGQDVPPGIYNDTITVNLSWSPGNGSANLQTFTVQTIVQPECRVDAFSMSFGVYDPFGTNLTSPLDAATTVNVRCTKSTAASVALNAGLNASGGTRRMKSAGGAFLNYDIYRDSLHSTIWNAVNVNSGQSTSKAGIINNGFFGYGRIPAGLDAAAGSYSDTVQAAINY